MTFLNDKLKQILEMKINISVDTDFMKQGEETQDAMSKWRQWK